MSHNVSNCAEWSRAWFTTTSDRNVSLASDWSIWESCIIQSNLQTKDNLGTGLLLFFWPFFGGCPYLGGSPYFDIIYYKFIL